MIFRQLQGLSNLCHSSPLSEDEIKTFLNLREEDINDILDSSIAPFYISHQRKHADIPGISSWWDFMLGNKIKETRKVAFTSEIYMKAMLFRCFLCYKHMPIGLLRRIINKKDKILDLGGGPGFFSALSFIFGAEPHYLDKESIASKLTQAFKQNICVLFGNFPEVLLPSPFKTIFANEVFHGRSKEEQVHWIRNLLPNILENKGKIIVNEVTPKGSTLYSRFFDSRIKTMTDGKGSALTPKELIHLFGDQYTITNLVTWHSLPYYTAIFEKE
jgi:hypothetical protein